MCLPDMALKENDFIEVDYSGRLKETGQLFDTSNVEEAQKAGMHSHVHAAVICLGRGQLLKGLENKLFGKEIGKEYTIALVPEEAFGKKDAKLLKIVPTNIFLKQGIRPMPSLQVNIDGLIGTIRTVSGGRTIVDFNHPLAGHEIEYTITVKRIVSDKKEQVKGFLELGAHLHDAEVNVKENKAEIKLKKMLPEQVTNFLSAQIKELMGLDVIFEILAEKKV